MQSGVLDFIQIAVASRRRHSRHPRADCRLAWTNKQSSDLPHLQFMTHEVFDIQKKLTRAVRLRFPCHTYTHSYTMTNLSGSTVPNVTIGCYQLSLYLTRECLLSFDSMALYPL